MPRESSLPPLLTVNEKLQENRCHSAPRADHQQVEQQVICFSMSAEPDQADAVESNSLPYEVGITRLSHIPYMTCKNMLNHG